MNLRFDSNSIRVRVSKDEAEKLLSEKHLSEVLPFPGKNLRFKINCDEDKSEGKPSENPSIRMDEHFEMHVSFQNLTRMLQPAEKGSKKSDELSGFFISEGRPAEVRFEIDRFSRKKMKD